MVKDRVRDDTVADKEERKRRKKALKKTNARQSNGEDASEDTIKTHAGDKQATSKTDVNNGKAKKIKKVKRRMSETEGEEEKEDLQAEATNGSSETKTKKRKKNARAEVEGESRDDGDVVERKESDDPSRGPESTGELSSAKKKKKKKEKKEKKSVEMEQTSAPASANGPDASDPPTNVHVEGMKINPFKDFDSVEMPAEVMKYVTDRKWTQPTPIQGYCWPVLNAGRDVIGIAETGSGKTLAFSLPAMSRIVRSRGAKVSNRRRGPTMLVLAPTRELALQSAEVIAEAGKHCGIRSTCVYGGVPKREQRIALGGGRGEGNSVEVVVATPGRLKDLVGEGVCDLSRVTSLVLDEADRMLDLGFEKDVREIIGYCAPGKKRQTAMFSATWPKSIRDLAAEFLNNPVKVTIGADDLTANARVEQHVEVVEERERDGKLLRLLSKCHTTRKNRVLVFALYKREAARLEEFLQRNHYEAVAVHGDKGQAQREHALNQFKSKERPLMVATDVAARGLDIPDVEYVINYSFPLTIEDYIHRIGRTGRAGKTGVSYTFFHQGDKARSGELVNVLQDANQTVPEALTKFGTHVKKKEHKLYGAFAKDVDVDKKSTKIKFEDSDDD